MSGPVGITRPLYENRGGGGGSSVGAPYAVPVRITSDPGWDDFEWPFGDAEFYIATFAATAGDVFLVVTSGDVWFSGYSGAVLETHLDEPGTLFYCHATGCAFIASDALTGGSFVVLRLGSELPTCSPTPAGGGGGGGGGT